MAKATLEEAVVLSSVQEVSLKAEALEEVGGEVVEGAFWQLAFLVVAVVRVENSFLTVV
jgi:hypothetical protein